jgi:hypothetical protein
MRDNKTTSEIFYLNPKEVRPMCAQMFLRILSVFLMSLILPLTAFAVPIVISDSGSDAAGIQAGVDSFRAAVGAPNNGDTPGPLPAGRREINWDGGGAATTVSGTPFTGFLNIRGALFTTPGTGFAQAPPTGFSNPTYGSIFETFSSLRLFAPESSNTTDVSFFIPGTNGAITATVSAFGVVFSDVDLANTTSLQYFDVNGDLLGTFFVPPENEGLSFLGVLFTGGELIGRVRITTGNSSLGPNEGAGVDVVAMDDFLYAEPRAVAAVPEPSTMLLLGSGLIGLAGYGRKKFFKK